ncbi:hypothetical protein COBT_002545, partial [Conglomerata obtusa]
MNIETVYFMSKEDMIYWAMNEGILNINFNCPSCSNELRLVATDRNINGLSWRCYNQHCTKYSVFTSVRKGSVFE